MLERIHAANAAVASLALLWALVPACCGLAYLLERHDRTQAQHRAAIERSRAARAARKATCTRRPA